MIFIYNKKIKKYVLFKTLWQLQQTWKIIIVLYIEIYISNIQEIL